MLRKLNFFQKLFSKNRQSKRPQAIAFLRMDAVNPYLPIFPRGRIPIGNYFTGDRYTIDKSKLEYWQLEALEKLNPESPFQVDRYTWISGTGLISKFEKGDRT